MQSRDGVFLEDLCPKWRARQWRRGLHELTRHRCLYCGAPSESIDHVFPRSRGGSSSDQNCVPACLACNGSKGDLDAFVWYRSQAFYDPRRSMALRAWLEGDRPLAQRLLSWTTAGSSAPGAPEPSAAVDRGSSAAGQAAAPPALATSGQAVPREQPDRGSGRGRRRPQQPGSQSSHQTRQASAPLWRWQIAS